VLIVDDCSTDKTEEIIDEFCCRNPLFRKLKTEITVAHLWQEISHSEKPVDTLSPVMMPMIGHTPVE
jgi:hypothetical protein